MEIKEIHNLFVKYSSPYDAYTICSNIKNRNSHMMNYNNFLEMTNDHTLPAIHSLFNKYSIISYLKIINRRSELEYVFFNIHNIFIFKI